jgi:hypothetical protein
MERELAEGPIGTVGKYDLDLKDGQLVLAVEAKVADGVLVAGLSIGIDAKRVARLLLTKVKEKIPGQVDDVLIDAVLAAIEKAT